MTPREMEKALRIGLVGPLPPPFGGMANQMKQLVRLLRSEQIDVEVVQTNTEYWPRTVGRFRRVRAFFRLVPYVGRLWRLAGRVDLIHVLANSGWSWQLFAAPAIWVGYLRGTPVIVNYRGGEAQEYFSSAIRWVRPTMERGSALVVPSGFLQKVFADFGFNAGVIPNIVDLDRFSPSGDVRELSSNSPHLVITRNLEAIYDIGTAIRAVARLRQRFPGLRLSIAGDGPERQALEALVAELNLGEVVDFVGRLSPDEVARLYKSADVMLNPSRVDNMPNSVLEALASGLPVVTTNVGGIPYLVTDGRTALFVDPGDDAAMADQVRRLLTDRALYRKLRENGLAEVREYVWPKVRDQWLCLYRQVVGDRSAGCQPGPRLIVFSSLFPHEGAPNAGVFVRERMFRVGQHLPVTVVSPKPWFPGQRLLRRWRSGLRPPARRSEVQQGIRVLMPRFFSVPMVLKRLDGILMAAGAYATLRRLKRVQGFDLIDAHFSYPDGYAATLLGRWLDVPVTITLRGTEVSHSRRPVLRRRLIKAWMRADRIFSVSESLRQHAIALGADPDKIEVVGNGVDIEKFHPEDRTVARERFGIHRDAKVLISVGALVERKGMHRVIELLPELLERFPNLHYLVVGGASPEGDMTQELERQIGCLGLDGRVHLLGPMASDEIRWPLSAADVFVLATRNEGWANVFLEAMACGLPVVTTDVGGNAEVVCRTGLGRIVPYGDPAALREAISHAFSISWDRQAIRRYAEENRWESRIQTLLDAFRGLTGYSGKASGALRGAEDK